MESGKIHAARLKSYAAILLLATMLGFVVLAVGVVLGVRGAALGATTMGEVTAVRPTESGYEIEYRYEASPGEPTTAVSPVRVSNDPPQVGDQHEVFFVPGVPDPVRPNTFAMRWFIAIAGGGLFAGFLLLFILGSFVAPKIVFRSVRS